jgi:hypothetical protein
MNYFYQTLNILQSLNYPNELSQSELEEKLIHISATIEIGMSDIKNLNDLSSHSLVATLLNYMNDMNKLLSHQMDKLTNLYGVFFPHSRSIDYEEEHHQSRMIVSNIQLICKIMNTTKTLLGQRVASHYSFEHIPEPNLITVIMFFF